MRIKWWLLPTLLASLMLSGYALWEQQWRRTLRTDMAYVEADLLYIKAQQSGIVLARYALELSQIAAGQPLLQLDDATEQHQLAKLQAEQLQWQQQLDANANQQAIIRHQLQQLKFDIALAQSELELAEADLYRQQQLQQQGLVQQRDLQQASHRVQRANIVQQKLQGQRQGLTLQQQQWQLQAAILQQDLAKNSLAQQDSSRRISQFRLLAPASGTLSSISVQAGELVNAGDNIATLVPTEAIWIEAYFKESVIAGITPGQRAEVRIDAFPEQRFAGEVIAASPLAGAKLSLISPNYTSGNFIRIEQRVPVRIRLSDSELPVLRPGLSARVTLTRAD
ncbi:HlyD family secretion protein [Arsukibacterium perlucidum]|uniref:HlyD family secretion protein n=1 Tax=Arsukibacterium perlucidum TaxID=368811 RepID=UPI000377EAC6|nr:HlyD family efflux transporter periplasmic adaptor subunit [Arsukibacterium perlucidum]